MRKKRKVIVAPPAELPVEKGNNGSETVPEDFWDTPIYYELKVNKSKDRIEFNLEKGSDINKFAYLDLKSGSIYQIGKKLDYITMGWDFYTSYMTNYKDQWDKIPKTQK